MGAQPLSSEYAYGSDYGTIVGDAGDGTYDYTAAPSVGPSADPYATADYGTNSWGDDSASGAGGLPGLPSVDHINGYANAQYAQTSAALDTETNQMNAQYEQYGQTIDEMNVNGQYDGILAQADQHDAQMESQYNQYGAAVTGQANADSWAQADAQSQAVSNGL